MQRTTLMLELEPRQVKALLAFTRQVSARRGKAPAGR